MPPTNFDEQLRNELEQLRAFAATSTDLCVSAQVIAASDTKVQHHLRDHIQSGQRLRVTVCLPPQTPLEQRVMYAFDNSPERIGLVPSAFLAVVDTRSRSVVRIVDPFFPGADGPDTSAPVGTSLPLSLAVPSAAASMAVPDATMASVIAQEQVFFDNLGIARSYVPAAPGTYSNVTCPINTVDWSTRNSPVATGTPSDTTVDNQADTVSDMKTDYPSERVADD